MVLRPFVFTTKKTFTGGKYHQKSGAAVCMSLESLLVFDGCFSTSGNDLFNSKPDRQMLHVWNI